MTIMTDAIRREMIETGQPYDDLEKSEEQGGQTWGTAELQHEFDVLGFAAPFVVVRRKADGKKGTLEFTHSPRIYFGWTEDEG